MAASLDDARDELPISSLRAETESRSVGCDKALKFLDQVREFATRLDGRAHQAFALASLGDAFLELGAIERAIELAEQATNMLEGPISETYEARVRTRIAAIYERAGRGEQDAVFCETLRFLSQRRDVASRKGLEEWFKALAKSRMPIARTRPLVELGIQAIAQNPLVYCAPTFKVVTHWLVQLGDTDSAQAIVRKLLAGLARDSSKSPTDDDLLIAGHEIIYLEELTTTLSRFRFGESFPRADARLIFERMVELGSQINEFTIPTALAVLRCTEFDFSLACEALADKLRRRGDDYPALNLELALITHRAELGQRDEALDRLPNFIEAVRKHHCSYPDCDRNKDFHRLRLLERVVAIIPSFGMSAQSVALHETITDFAGELNDRVRSNLHSASIINQVRLGNRPGIMELLENSIAQCERLVDSGRWYEFSVPLLEAVAEGLENVGEPLRGIALTRRIVELAEKSLDEDWSATQFWVYNALIGAGITALRLGDAAFAEALLDRIFASIKRRVTFGFDRIDLLKELMSAVKNLTSARRFDMTLEILTEMLAACREVGDFGHDETLKLFAIVADDLVRSVTASAA